VTHRRRSLLVVAVVTAVLASVGAVSTAAAVPAGAAGAAASTQAPATSAIKHVIVVMQSGHSFDSYFGTRQGVDGIPSGVCLTVVAGSPGCVKPYHLDPGQSRAGLSDTLRVTQRSINGGKMDGFVRAQPNASIGATSMGYLNRQDLPYYWNLADRFTLYDHFFAASRAGALPNRVAAVAGQDGGLTSSTAPAGGITTPTVFDQLDRAGLSWKYYVENYKGVQQAASAGQQSEAPVLAMPAIAGDPARASHIVNTNQYFDDLLDGKLPAVSYVAGTVDSERSPLDPTLGEFFVKSLVNALMQSSAWKDTVLLVTYDSSGGWYDHAPPPVMGGVAQGIRVPMLMVSPFARAGVVDNSVLNTTAIPGMIDQVFGLPQLTGQTAAAGSLLSGADFAQKPIAPLIAPLPGGATVAPRPNVLVVYGVYLLMFLATCLVGYLAFRRSRRPDVVTDDLPEPGADLPSSGGNTASGEAAAESESGAVPVAVAVAVAVAESESGSKAEAESEGVAESESGSKAEAEGVAESEFESGSKAEAKSDSPDPDPSEPQPAVVVDVRPVRLFRLADVTNPYDSGTPEHDAWTSGYQKVAMSVGTEAMHATDSAECVRMASAMRQGDVSIEAAVYTGMAAAHTEACANLKAAKRVNAKKFAADAEFSPVARNGRHLQGTSRSRYVQGYARGRNESAQVDDPSTYLERAVAASEAVPHNRYVDYALARGRADGARRTLADRQGGERTSTPGEAVMLPAHGDPATAGDADHQAPPTPTRAR